MKSHKSKLLAIATKYQKQSHSPYSNCSLGAAVLTDDDKVYGGCNIENASYGGTVCAERVAIWKALSENKNQKIKEILVLSPGNIAWPPCGLCRQVLSEFATPSTLVHSANHAGIQKSWNFKDLFPESFEISYLQNEDIS